MWFCEIWKFYNSSTYFCFSLSKDYSNWTTYRISIKFNNENWRRFSRKISWVMESNRNVWLLFKIFKIFWYGVTFFFFVLVAKVFNFWKCFDMGFEILSVFQNFNFFFWKNCCRFVFVSKNRIKQFIDFMKKIAYFLLIVKKPSRFLLKMTDFI